MPEFRTIIDWNYNQFQSIKELTRKDFYRFKAYQYLELTTYILFASCSIELHFGDGITGILLWSIRHSPCKTLCSNLFSQYFFQNNVLRPENWHKQNVHICYLCFPMHPNVGGLNRVINCKNIIWRETFYMHVHYSRVIFAVQSYWKSIVLQMFAIYAMRHSPFPCIFCFCLKTFPWFPFYRGSYKKVYF
jgi:hypothetical protein